MNTEKKIASYEDACRVLNIQPINEEVFNIFPKEDQRSMLAYHKLTVITRALKRLEAELGRPKRMEVLPAIPLCKCRAFVRVCA